MPKVVQKCNPFLSRWWMKPGVFPATGVTVFLIQPLLIVALGGTFSRGIIVTEGFNFTITLNHVPKFLLHRFINIKRQSQYTARGATPVGTGLALPDWSPRDLIGQRDLLSRKLATLRVSPLCQTYVHVLIATPAKALPAKEAGLLVANLRVGVPRVLGVALDGFGLVLRPAPSAVAATFAAATTLALATATATTA